MTIPATLRRLSLLTLTNTMHLSFIILLCLHFDTSTLTSANFANNQYPIIMVPGFMGWGPSEMLGIKYFGGFQGDLRTAINQAHNVPVHVTAPGPFSSSWDRACEIYAQIKGGVVDYGELHSTHYGHSRYGREFPEGLYPEWGTMDPKTNTRRKIHLIGHSMGGQTIRLLSHLLKHGVSKVPLYHNQNFTEASELLRGGKADWIHSITTISTPHEGTMTSDGLSYIKKTLINAVTSIVSILGISPVKVSQVYDTKLDHWGFGPIEKGESIRQYVDRIGNSKLWDTESFIDLSIHDLSCEGATEMNKWLQLEPEVYYFSFASRDSYDTTTWYDGATYAINNPYMFSMLIPFQPISKFIGGIFTTVVKQKDDSWLGNDGVVNTASMFGFAGSEIVPYDHAVSTGRWHAMPLLDRFDHAAAIGFTFMRELPHIYTRHADLLLKLPETFLKGRRKLMEMDTMDTIEEMNAAIDNVKLKAAKIQSESDFKEFCTNEASTDVAKQYCHNIL